MAKSVVGFAVERLAYLLIHKASFLLEVKDQVEQMQTELRRMQCFLEDADAKQEEDKKVRNWIAEIREVAYDAEDVVENFILHVEKEGKIRGMVRQMDFSVGSKIQDIQKKISDLTRSLETYGIKTVRESEASSSRYELQQRRRRTYPHLIEEDVVGLEENVKELVNYLVRDEKCRVVSICGMGGLGKTTLATKVYHQTDVRSYFDSFAWAYISQQCRPQDVLQGIFIDLCSPKKDERKVITTQKVLFYTFKSLCFKHFCVVILHLYSNWHVKDLAMTPNHICG